MMDYAEIIASKLKERWLMEHGKDNLAECSGKEIAECLKWVDQKLGALILITKT